MLISSASLGDLILTGIRLIYGIHLVVPFGNKLVGGDLREGSSGMGNQGQQKQMDQNDTQ